MSRYLLRRYLLRQESFLDISENFFTSLIQKPHFPRVKNKSDYVALSAFQNIHLEFTIAIITLYIDNCNHLV